MKKILCAILAITICNWVCLAQTAVPSPNAEPGSDAKAAVSNAAGQDYPKIDSLHRAEFRLRAPSAEKVQVDIGGHKYDMASDDIRLKLSMTMAVL